MRIALVDDDSHFLQSARVICQEFCWEHGKSCQIDSFPSGEAFLQQFHPGLYDLIFLDIYMDGMDGIAAASEIRQIDHKVKLVFMTSSSEFMPEAFSFHSFDYLVKPLEKNRLIQVLTDVMELDAAAPFVDLVSGRQTYSVFLNDIVYVVTDAHYLEIKLTEGQILRCRMTISEFRNQTNHEPRFLCVNKGVLINADYVSEMTKSQCILEDGSVFPVKVRESKKILQELRNYQFEKIRNQPLR